MPNVEILLQAKNQTDAAFKALLDHLKKTEDQGKKTNDILGKLSDDLKGKLGGAAENAAGGLGGLGSALTALGPGGVAAAAAIGTVVAAMTAAIKVSYDAAMAAAAYGDKIVDLAGKTDLSTDSLQAFDVMARTGNTSVEAISAAVLKMQRGLVDGSDAFRRLGLDINQLKQLSAEEQFRAVAVAIEGLGTNAERSAARVAIFGKSGDELTTVLHEAATGATELGGALSEDALQASADLQDQVDLLKTAWERVWLQFGAVIAQSPELRQALDLVTDVVVKMAEAIAKHGPLILEVFESVVSNVKRSMIALEAVVRSGTVGPVEAFKEMKSKLEDLHLENLFSDVNSGSSTSQQKRSFGPSDADIARYKKAAEEARKLIAEENKLREHTALEWEKFFKTINKEEAALTDWVEAQAKARTDAVVRGFIEEHEERQRNIEASKASYEEMARAMLDAQRHAFDGWANALHDVDSLFAQLGITADSTLGGIVSTASQTADMIASAAQRGFFTLQELASQAIDIFKKGSPLQGAISGAMTGFAIGGPVGAAVGGGIGLITGALGKLFGGASKARQEMQKLRSEFVQSMGGMSALQQKAQAAGVSLDAMFKSKSAAQLQRAIGDIRAQLDLWEEGQNAINAAMDKYGITVAEMGPKFAQQELDKQAMEVAKAFAVLTTAGGDASAIAQKMGTDVMELVKQYQAAGLAIPAALRPVLEAMLKNGQLTNENGEAYKSLEEAGITFAETMTEAMASMTKQLEELVKVLARGFNIPINVSYSSSGDPGPGALGPRPPRDEEVPQFANAFIPHRPGGTLGKVGERTDEYAIEAPALRGLLADAIRMAGAANGGSAGGVHVTVPVSISNRDLGMATANISRRRQGQQSPNNVRRF